MRLELESIGKIGTGIEALRGGDDDTVYLRIQTAGGTPSSSGKMILSASTGGWTTIPGVEGFKLNLTAGRKS